MYWADEIAESIINRLQKDVYRVHDYKTPSGRVHVGALRGVVIHSIVQRALAARGVTTEYTYGFDDYDPMDGFPNYLDESFRQYMGMPLSEIPSPDPAFSGSFGEYYSQEFATVFNGLGITPRIVRSSDMYKSGAYNEAIRQTLDKAAVIRAIYKQVSGGERRDDWYALNTICENCKKIGTTRVYAWDGTLVSYKCEPTMVKWAQGCGHEGQISPFDGNAKMPWKVEWPSKWFIFNEAFETAGKDHMTKNGSHDVAAEIARQVFGIEPPIGREFPYEWLLVGGRKMSSSKGVGASAKEVAALLPAHLLNFLFANTKPNRHLEFDPSGTTMPLLYDEYDRAIAAYNQDKESDLAKMIEYTKAEGQVIPAYVMRFSKVAFLIQMPSADIWQIAAAEKGSDLASEDVLELEERITYARQWLAEFAPDEMKFTLQQQAPSIEINDTQCQFLADIVVDIESQPTLDGAALHAKIHELKKQYELAPADSFGLLYMLFLGKTSGPQVGWFLAALDRDFVLERLKV